jgi:hypothetical protein
MKHERRAELLRWPRMLREWMSAAASRDNSETWSGDPLSHPAIEAMSMRQLADLPLDRFRIHSEEVRLSNGDFRMKAIFAGALVAGSLVSGLPAHAQNPESTVAFEMPVNVESWRPDIVAQNGMYRFRQVQGACQITFVQNLGADAAKAAGRTPRDTIEAYVRRLSKQVDDVARSKAPDLALRANSGEPVSFLSEAVSYRGQDGTEYRNRIATQWVEAVELLIIAACPSSEWKTQEAAIDAFITKVSVHR